MYGYNNNDYNIKKAKINPFVKKKKENWISFCHRSKLFHFLKFYTYTHIHAHKHNETGKQVTFSIWIILNLKKKVFW
jgi:hypothetical protein